MTKRAALLLHKRSTDENGRTFPGVGRRSSIGIGRAIAVLYAREGGDVAIIYLNEHRDADDTLHINSR